MKMSTVNNQTRQARAKGTQRTAQLVSKTTQVYEDQWQTLISMAQANHRSVAEMVRESIDDYITLKGLRPKLISDLKKLFQAEVSAVVGQHLQASEAKARLEIEATQGTLQTLTEQLAIVLTHQAEENATQRTELGQIKKDNAIQRRELDQIIDALEARKVPIQRG